MRESRSLQLFQKWYFLTLWWFVVCCFFLNDFCLVLLFSNFAFEELGFTYEIFQIFFFLFVSLFRFSCNIYRRNNTTISRDMREKGERERERERGHGSKFRKSDQFRSYFFFFRGCCRTNAKRRCNGGNNEHKRWNQQKSGSRERERYPFLPIIV